MIVRRMQGDRLLPKLHCRRGTVGKKDLLATSCGMPLDATIGRGRVSADHIAFATSALDSASIGDLFLGLVPIFAGVDLELVEADERK